MGWHNSTRFRKARPFPGLLMFVMVMAVGPSVLAVRSEEGTAPLPISVERIREDIRTLASDRFEGRGVGTRAESLTVEYLAESFRRAGLLPAGDDGTYFQRVPLVGLLTQPDATLTLEGSRGSISFRWGEEFVGQCHTQTPLEDFDAEAVFVGHGIVAPEFGWDDYGDVDVRGKVVILFTNEPPSTDRAFFGGPALTYYGRWTFKFEEATRRGAKAALIIHTNETAGYPYSVVQRGDSTEGAQISRLPGTPALALAGWLSRSAGEKLLAQAGTDVEKALAESNTRGFRARPLGFRLKGHLPTRVRNITSKNVVAKIEGSDPQKRSEAVLFTAHWDHLGLSKMPLGDGIFNGAADNATGCAILLELARLWQAQPDRPKRSAYFLVTTAEEQGLLGAMYYARHPVVPMEKTALNLNFDMVLPMGEPLSVVVDRAERTTAWPVVQKAAKGLNLEIETDKLAHLGMYYRSDHFALARAGVPAFAVYPGGRVKGKPDDYFQKSVARFIASVYHTPGDEFREDWDFSGYPILMTFAFRVACEVANQEQLPAWNQGEEFQTRPVAPAKKP